MPHYKVYYLLLPMDSWTYTVAPQGYAARVGYNCARHKSLSHFLLYPLIPHEQKVYRTLHGRQHRKLHSLYFVPSSSDSSPSTVSRSSKPKKSGMKNRIQDLKISQSHYEDSSILGCHTMLLGVQLPECCRIMVP
jgi:hypothetical protein